MSIYEDSDPLTVTDPDGLARMIDLRFRDGDLDAVRAGELLVSRQEMTQRGWRFGQDLPVIFPTAGVVPMRIGAVLDEPVVGPGSAPINLLVADAVVAGLGIERSDRLVWLSPADGVPSGDVERVLDEALASYPGVEWNDRARVHRPRDRPDRAVPQRGGWPRRVVGDHRCARDRQHAAARRARTDAARSDCSRAVGMSRRQVRTMVQAEGAILAALGVPAGIGLGLLLAFVFGRTWRGQGFDTYAVPVPLLVSSSSARS